MTLAISDTVKIVLSTFRKRKLITKTTIPLRNSKLALVIFLLSVTPFYCFSNIPNSIFKLQNSAAKHTIGNDPDLDTGGLISPIALNDDNEGWGVEY
jgi:hypothetical protein